MNEWGYDRVKLADAMREIAQRNNLTQAQLAKKAGYKSVSVVSGAIKANDIRVSTLLRLINAGGYDMLLVKRSALVPESPILVESDGRDIVVKQVKSKT